MTARKKLATSRNFRRLGFEYVVIRLEIDNGARRDAPATEMAMRCEERSKTRLKNGPFFLQDQEIRFAGINRSVTHEFETTLPCLAVNYSITFTFVLRSIDDLRVDLPVTSLK